MKRLMVRTGLVVFLLSTKSHAQSRAVIPSGEAGHATQASCVILKHMGRVDRTKTRLYSLGISGKQFRYVEGRLPEGFSPHRKMTDHDVRSLQERGAQVLVLDSHYSSEDLQEARAACQRETGKTLNEVEAKALPAPVPIASSPAPASKPLAAKVTSPKPDGSAPFGRTADPAASAPAPATRPPTAMPPAASVRTPRAEDSGPATGTTLAALLDVSSTPAGADVYVDERFFGQTPATTIILVPGDHKITIKKDGFATWKKKLKLPSGRINVDAELTSKAK